eukprot:5643797-Pleurochrysis_carterae.AAC.1
MGGMARRSLGLSPGAGTAFYEFKQIPSAKDFIESWYAQLNELDLTEEQAGRAQLNEPEATRCHEHVRVLTIWTHT